MNKLPPQNVAVVVEPSGDIINPSICIQQELFYNWI
jgi:hypothetical protein